MSRRIVLMYFTICLAIGPPWLASAGNYRWTFMGTGFEIVSVSDDGLYAEVNVLGAFPANGPSESWLEPLAQAWCGYWRAIVAFIAIMLAGALVFFGQSLTLVGTPYIIVFAFAVRSLPASVRAGVASLQQVDPSIEEASNILGGDAQYTFRNVTLPLILPAFFAGLVFAFARHMTSLSAVIFLTTAQWPILTVWILSEVEQGGMSVAAAYSIILIAIVLAAIGIMSLWLKRAYGGRQDVDLSAGGG